MLTFIIIDTSRLQYHANGGRGTGEWPDLRRTKAIDRVRLPPLHLRIYGADDNRLSEDDGPSRRCTVDERKDATTVTMLPLYSNLFLYCR